MFFLQISPRGINDIPLLRSPPPHARAHVPRSTGKACGWGQIAGKKGSLSQARSHHHAFITSVQTCLLQGGPEQDWRACLPNFPRGRYEMKYDEKSQRTPLAPCPPPAVSHTCTLRRLRRAGDGHKNRRCAGVVTLSSCLGTTGSALINSVRRDRLFYSYFLLFQGEI